MTAPAAGVPIPVAFYAPLKPPDHPVPSGDRQMARNLVTALGAAGFSIETASRFRSHEPLGDEAQQTRLREEGAREVERLVEALTAAPAEQRPRLWFTYHLYYKAPDWVGPAVSKALSIPYAVAEGSRASKRAGGPWALYHQGAEAALDAASVVFVINEADREALERHRPPRQTLVALPPFLAAPFAPAQSPARPRSGPVRLLTVAMMRNGDKLASYRLLAKALALVADRDWRLTIVGNGEALTEVAQAFAPLGERVDFHGRIDDPTDLGAVYAEADLLVWPAVNEAYGMVLLEAQAQGCPVVAGRFGGVPEVIRDGETGLLARPHDAGDFAAAVRSLLDDPARRIRMGEVAERFVRTARGLDGAAAILRRSLSGLLGHPAPTDAPP